MSLVKAGIKSRRKAALVIKAPGKKLTPRPAARSQRAR